MAAADYTSVVQQIYVAYFGRPADAIGLKNFSEALDAIRVNGATLKSLAVNGKELITVITEQYSKVAALKSMIDAFGTSTESQTLYAGSSTAVFVNAIYKNVFNRDADAEGLLFWGSAIDSGALTRGAAALNIMQGALTNTSTQGQADAALIAKKIAVATSFTAALDTNGEILAYSGDAAAAAARNMLGTVTKDTNTTTFQATVNSTIDNLVLVNQTFVLAPSASSVNEGASATFNLTTTGVADGTVVAYTLSGVDAADLVSGSLTGQATVTGGKATITVALKADATTEGAETLGIALNNGKATASIAVNDTSLTPTVSVAAAAASVNEGSTATFNVTTDAADGTVLSYTLSGVSASDVTGGLTGQVTVSGGKATISVPLVADATTEGAETLTVTVGGATASATVGDTSITPVLGTDTLMNTPGSNVVRFAPSSLLVNDFGSNGAVLTGTPSVVAGSAVNGNILVDSVSGDWIFVPTTGARSGSFQYTVNGVSGVTGTANLTFNAAPSVTAAAVTTNEDTAVTGTVAATDSDGDTLTYTFSNGSKGSVTPGTGGAFTYTPNLDANGSDTITVTVSDGFTTVTKEIAVTITAVDDAPKLVTPAPATISANSGTTVTVDLSKYATDVDTAAGALVYTLTGGTTAKGGTVTVSGSTATIVYAQGGGEAATGADSFGFTVSDGTNPAVSATVNLNVKNTAPVATDIALSAKTGVTQTIDLTGKVTDAEGNTLTPTVVVGSLSSGGSAEVVNGKIVYTSTIGFTGTETLSYYVTDGFGGTSNTGTITFTVSSNTGGTSGNDLLYGSKSAEAIDGLAGMDTINGGGGLDTITGGDGNDTVTFSDGASQILGGNDLDTLVVGSDAVASTFNFNAANAAQQNLDGNSKNSLNQTVVLRGFENLDASKASNAITFTSGANTTSITTGAANDNITVTESTGTVTVVSGVGNDTVNGGAMTGKMSVDGGAGNDSITGSAQNDTLLGGEGNDTITSNAGVDSINGGAGADRIVVAGNLTSADTIDGGDGSDTLSASGAIADAAFTNIVNVEILSAEATNTTNASLGAKAMAAGLTTVTFNDDATGTDTLTVGSGFTKALTVNLDADSTKANSVSASAYTGALTVNAALSSVDSQAHTITGGTGSDTLAISIDATKTANVTKVTNVETIKFTDGDTTAAHTATITLNDDMATYTSSSNYQTLTVDAAALVDDILTVDASAEADAKVVITGGEAADVITISKSANFGDSITGGKGNDNIKFTNANLTSADTISGGDGTDSLTLLNEAAVADAQFTSVTGVEVLTSDTGVELKASLGAKAAAAGITTVTFNNDTDANDTLTVGSGFTSALTVNLDATDTNANTVSASAYTGALTVKVKASAADDSSHTITGGTGSDTLQVSVDATKTVLVSDVTNVETFSFIDGDTTTAHTVTVALANGNATFTSTSDYQTITVDASALVADILTVDASSENNAKVVIKGGEAADVITVSASANFGDSITGGKGNDNIKFTNANLTSADTISGGDGTDSLTLLNEAAVADAQFTSVTGVEVLTSDTNIELKASLGAKAAAAGITTVTFNNDNDANDTLTVGSGFTSALTVNLDATDTNANTVSASAYTGALTVKVKATAADDSSHTITGGTGSDTLQVSVDATKTVLVTDVTNVETFSFIDGDTTTAHTVTVALVDGNATFTSTSDFQTITVDGSTLVDDILTVNANAEANAKVVIKGGEAADVISISKSANFGDSITAGKGNDTINVVTTADLTSKDTIDGGAGTDTISFNQAAGNAVTDAMFTSLTSIEKVSLGTDTTGQSVTLGTKAVAAGVNHVTAAAVTTATKTVTIDLSGMVGATGVSITGGSGGDIILGSTGNDTISGGAANANDVITGGAGADKITLDSGGTGMTVIKLNLNADVASGTTLANADQWTGFTTTKSKLDLSGTTLMSTGGTILALTNGAVTSSDNTAAATTNDTYSADTLTSAAGRFLSTGTVGDLANLGALSNQGVLIFKLTTDIVTGTTSGVANTLLNQAGVDEAVSYITANIGTATVANTNVFFIVQDGTNSAIFQYQEGALDQGIQASELTLMGVFVGINNVASGDII